MVCNDTELPSLWLATKLTLFCGNVNPASYKTIITMKNYNQRIPPVKRCNNNLGPIIGSPLPHHTYCAPQLTHDPVRLPYGFALSHK